MGSMIGYFVIILLAAGSVLAAALFFRHRQKQVMNGLSDMLGDKRHLFRDHI